MWGLRQEIIYIDPNKIRKVLKKYRNYGKRGLREKKRCIDPEKEFN